MQHGRNRPIKVLVVALQNIEFASQYRIGDKCLEQPHRSAHAV